MTGSRDPSDEDLALLSKDGNLTAFNRLVERHQAGLYTLCNRMLRDSGAAEDASQESFVSAYRAIDRFNGGSFRAWLFRIAVNICRDELRRRKRRPVSSLQAMGEDHETAFDPPDPGASTEDSVLRGALSSELERALAALPTEQREVILMIDLFDMTYEEASKATGASVGTVKSRVFRGRGSLRRALGPTELSPAAARLER